MAEIAIDTETGTRNEDGSYTLELDAQKPLSASTICKIGKVEKKHFFNLHEKPNSCYEWLLQTIEKEGKRGKATTIIMLNAQYDTIAIMKNHLFDKEVKIRSHSPFICQITTPKGTGRIIDLITFYCCKLEKIGEIVELPKLKMPEKVWRIEDLREYNMRDTEITMKGFELLKKTIKKLGYEPKKWLTAPKLAYNYLIHTASKQYYEKPQEDGTFKKIPYSSYWWFKNKIHPTAHAKIIEMACRGGRTQLLAQTRKKYENVYKIDVNSMYPHVCSTRKFPDLLTETLEKNLEEENWNNILNKIGIIKCTITSPSRKIGYLPIKYGKKTVYPTNCEMTGFWYTHEIKTAIEKYGYTLQEIETAITYKDLPFPMFKTHYEKLYTAKRTANKEMKTMIKLLMNSATGKFKQKLRGTDTEKINLKECREWQQKGYELKSKIDDNTFIVEKKPTEQQLANCANPIIYGLITSYARDYLYETMMKIKQENILYISTDAIIFTEKQYIQNINISEEMGDWKIEAQNATAEFFATNWYTINEELKSSGLNKIMKENRENVKEIMDNLKTGKPIETIKMTKIGTAFRTGNLQEIGKFTKTQLNINTEQKVQEQEILPRQITEPDPRDILTIEKFNEFLL